MSEEPEVEKTKSNKKLTDSIFQFKRIAKIAKILCEIAAVLFIVDYIALAIMNRNTDNSIYLFIKNGIYAVQNVAYSLILWIIVVVAERIMKKNEN